MERGAAGKHASAQAFLPSLQHISEFEVFHSRELKEIQASGLVLAAGKSQEGQVLKASE